jgi:hypothetical protein
MPDTIKDGTGGGYSAKVDNKNRLRTYSVIEDEPTFINRVEQQFYSGAWGSGGAGIKGATADNWVLYLKNNNDSKLLVVESIKHRTEDGNGSLSIWLNVEGTPGGSLTTLTPTNRNAVSNNEADVDYYRSDNITGLSNGRKVLTVYGKQDENFQKLDICGGLILPPGGVLAAKCSDSTAEHFGGISFYFREDN